MMLRYHTPARTLCALSLLLAIVVALSGADAEDPATAKKVDSLNYTPRLTELDKRIESALDKKVNWNYEETKLSDIIADLAKQVDFPITLDEDYLPQSGEKLNGVFTLQLGNTSLRAGLQFLHDIHEVGYYGTATGLCIGDSEKASANLIVRVYPVSDLVRRDPGFTAYDSYDFEELIDTITAILSTDTWVDNGGQGSISGYDSSLVISQSLPVHDQIARFLAGVRTVRSDQEKLKPGEVGPTVSLRDTSAVQAALAKRDSGNIDLELKWFIADIIKVTKVPITLDAAGLSDAGVTRETMLRGTYRDAVVGDVFRETLAQHNLAPVHYDGFLCVTSQEKAAEIGLEVRLYPVRGLIGEPLKEISAPAGMSTPLSGLTDFDVLIDLITSTITPDTWSYSGGAGSIMELSQSRTLLVSQTPELHARLGHMLADLRVANADAPPGIPTNERIIQKTYPLYLARRQLQAKIALGETKKINAVEKAAMPSQQPANPSSGEPHVQPQFAGLIGLPPADGVVAPIPSSDDVAELIRELLPAESWKEEEVLLKPFHDVLIIRQRPAMFRKIEKLLREIDAWNGMSTGGPKHSIANGYY